MAATAVVATPPRPKIEEVVAGAATAAVVVPEAAVAEPGAVAVPKGDAEGIRESRAPCTWWQSAGRQPSSQTSTVKGVQPNSQEDLSETHVALLRKAIAPSP